ncbi:protein spaetzle-like isoform X1 [Frieseomelitta varia]|uniref:protein spaetzle-like isoform X1 n=1 Tax=Frieseomelitta varia TaxID=561572 RepID=UPI001CB6A6B1|nr:protein spaetzle-like isoform X1 [Frieseomelitta varia]
MKEHRNMIAALNIVIVLLQVFNVHSDSRQWYENPRVSLSESWRLPINQYDAKVETKRSTRQINNAAISESDNIVFPDTNVKSMRMETAPSCQEQTFCEDVPNYPSNLVKEIISKNPHLKNYKTVDMLETFRSKVDNSFLDTESLCASIEQIVIPKTAQNIKNEWLYIVNNEDVVQGVRIEKCLNENSSCKLIDGFAGGYKTICKQKYIYHQLVGLTNNNSLSYESFRFPSSCCCHVKFVGTSIRFGQIDVQTESDNTN